MSIIREITIKAKKYLTGDEILLFVGARQAGKTTILKQLEAFLKEKGEAVYFLNLEDLEYVSLLDESPKNIFKIFTLNLEKRNYVFMDEIQYLKNPTNFLKYIYDEYREKIKLLASGSSAFYIDKKFKDSLADRKKLFYVYTLSFREFLRFKNEFELAEKDLAQLGLADQDKVWRYYLEFIIFGGYPRVVLADGEEEKKEILRELAFSYIKKDILEAGVKQEELFYKLFRLLAVQVGSLVNTSELADTLDVSRTTIDNYLYIMQRSFHLALVKPFFSNMRKELTRMPKVFFYDLGLRNFFVNDFAGFAQRRDCGQVLENAVFRQLLEKYSLYELNFWRTIQKQEIDFVAANQEAFEVKSDLKALRVSNFKAFKKAYPEINLRVVSLGKKRKEEKGFKVLWPWEV